MTRSTRLDLGEVDDRDRVLFGHVAVVELPEEGDHVLGALDLRVVLLDLARGALAQRLHLDLVDDRVEDLLPRAEALAGEHLHDHPLPVLAGLVAEADGDRLAPAPQLVGDDRRVEVEGVHRPGEGDEERPHHTASSESSLRARSAISALAPVGQEPRRLVEREPARRVDLVRVLGRDVAEAPAPVAEEVEADHLEDPLALPRVDVADVPELLDQAALDAGLLGHLPRGRVGGALAGPDQALRQRPDLLPARPDRGQPPAAAQPPDDDASR